MVGSSLPNRRVSIGYILGFTNKPLKNDDTPAYKPPKPNPCIDLMTTPGAIIEWAASDGRKGVLTGKGKNRLTAATSEIAGEATNHITAVNLEELVLKGEKVSKFKSKSKKPQGMKEHSHKSVAGDDDDQKLNPHGFTKEQDKRLMELKSTVANADWKDIAVEVGKESGQCKARFKVIKPKDWRPPTVEKKNKGKGNEQGGDKQNAWQKDSPKQDKKSEAGSVAWGATGLDVALDFGGDDWAGKTEDDKKRGENKSRSKGAGVQTWGSSMHRNDRDPKPQDTTGNIHGGWAGSGLWNETKAPKDTSVQVANVQVHPIAEHKKHHKNEPVAGPVKLRLKADDTFSAHELKAIARIMQQDSQMMWHRVSYRFGDKTGRFLSPEIFEKKMTGQSSKK